MTPGVAQDWGDHVLVESQHILTNRIQMPTSRLEARAGDPSVGMSHQQPSLLPCRPVLAQGGDRGEWHLLAFH